MWRVEVRAERAGGRDERVYTVEVTATDASGNAASQIFTVTVPRRTPLVATP